MAVSIFPMLSFFKILRNNKNIKDDIFLLFLLPKRRRRRFPIHGFFDPKVRGDHNENADKYEGGTDWPRKKDCGIAV